MTLIDTHCHLNDPNLSISPEEAIANAKAVGVTHFVVPGMDLATSERAIELAAEYPGICFPTVGIHPHAILSDQPAGLKVNQLRALAAKPAVVAIGEIGIDYHHHGRDETGAVQREAFSRMLQIALNRNLPAIIHGRDAYPDVLEVIAAHPGARCVLHSFEASDTIAKRALDLGCLIGITALITYKHSHILKNVIQSLPLDRLMLETDAPYLPPQSIRDQVKSEEQRAKGHDASPFTPHSSLGRVIGARGRNNQPAYMVETAEILAQLLKVDLDTVARATTATARQFFNLPKVAG